MNGTRRFLLSVMLLFPVAAFGGVYDAMLNAVKIKDFETVRDLLDRGMDVNTTDDSGNSLLMLAAQQGSFSIVEWLLRKGAKVLIKNKYGDSALMLAALRGDLPIVDALVAAGAEIDPEGWTPLIYAAFGGHQEVVRFLLKLDVDIDAQASNGMTALMAASRNGHLEVVRILLDHDADQSLANQQNLTAMDLATTAGSREIASELSRAARR